ncbi:MAG: hypothetical protein WKG01_24735 [Kofleriaceae bacterium]
MSRTTYERLKAFCEANSISMSQLVETRVNDFLGEGMSPSTGGGITITPSVGSSFSSPPTSHAPRATQPAPVRPIPAAAPAPRPMLFAHSAPSSSPSHDSRPVAAPVASQPVPMTSAAARYAIEPPPPIIKPKAQEPAPKPAEKRPDQIFTF